MPKSPNTPRAGWTRARIWLLRGLEWFPKTLTCVDHQPFRSSVLRISQLPCVDNNSATRSKKGYISEGGKDRLIDWSREESLLLHSS